MSLFARRRSQVVLWPALVLLATLGVQSPTTGQEPNRAAVVVQHGDLETSGACVTFPSDTISGLELLERSGFEYIAQEFDFGRSICWLDGEGCNYPEEDCFCDPVNFWGYWTQDDGEPLPTQSDVGPDDRTVEDGDLDHWVWGAAGSAPVPKDFSDVCPAQAGSPEPTATPSTTSTPFEAAGSDPGVGDSESAALPNTGTGPVPLAAAAAVLMAPAAVLAVRAVLSLRR